METPGPSRRALFRGQLLSKPVAIINERLLRRSRHRLPLLRRFLLCFSDSFPPRIGLPPQPIVDEAACTGCGECVAACPGEAIMLGAARHGAAS